MAKKIVLAALVMAIAAGAISAQENNKAAALDLFTLTKGFVAADSDSKTFLICLAASYEQLVAPHFSAGGNLDMYFGKVYDTGAFYMGITGEGRYYPMTENFEKFFMGTTLGFNVFSVDGNTNHGGFLGLTASLKAGYKLLFTGKSLYVEPSMAYVLSKAGIVPVTPLGWQGGLRMGIVF